MSYQAAIRRIRRTYVDGKSTQSIRFTLGTIDHVTGGASADGVTAAFVTIGADTIPAPYLSSYTPVAGHMVAVLLVNNSPIILGRSVGLPAF